VAVRLALYREGPLPRGTGAAATRLVNTHALVC
jgi:hypothetical protein